MSRMAVTDRVLPSLRFAALLLALAAVAGCGPASEPTIRLLGEDSSNLKAMRSLQEEYFRSKGVRVEFNAEEFSIANQKANTDLSQQTGVYDLLLQYNFSLASFARNRYVLDLAEQHEMAPTTDFTFEKRLFEPAWREVGFYYQDPAHPSVGERALGYPFSANTMVLVYNKRLFDNETNKQRYREQFHSELVVPSTWKQFADAAAFFGSLPETKGVALQGASGGWLYYEWMNFLFGMGGSTMSKDRGWKGDIDTPILLASKEGRAALRAYLDLKPFNAGDFFSTDATRQRDSMRAGNVAMAIMWSDYIFDLVHRQDGTFDDNFGFAPIPGEKSMLAGGAFYVNRWSKNPKAAIDFVSFVLQPENQAKLMSLGLCSPIRDAYQTPEASKLPYKDALLTSLERGSYMLEAGPDADAIAETVTEFVQRAWRGELSVDAALDGAVKQINDRRKEIYSKLGSH